MPPTPRARHLLLTTLVFLAFISLGLPDGVLGIAWPSIRSTFGRPLSQLGFLLAASTAGYLTSSFFAGQAIRVLGLGKLLVGSAALATLALAGYAAAPAFEWMILLAAIGGLGGGAIDSGINAFAASRFSPRIMNWLHACWGIGATTGPLVMTFILSASFSWRIGYAILAGILAVLVVLFLFTQRFWQLGEGAAGEAHHATATITDALRRPIVWAHILVFLTYAGIETTAGQLLYTVFTESRGLSTTTAGMTIAAYWAALTLGRVFFGHFAVSLGRRATLRIGTIGAPAAAALIWLNPVPHADLAGAALLGLFLAPIFPTLMSATPDRVGQAFAPHAVGFQVSAAALGFVVFPSLVAIGARRWGMDTIGVYLLAASLLLLMLQELAVRMAAASASTMVQTAGAIQENQQ